MSDPIKEIERLMQAEESMRRGDHISHIEYTGDDAISRIAAELNQVRQDFEKYRSEYAADKAAQEHRLKLDFRKNVAVSAVSALLTASAANIIAYCWPDIIAFFSGIFQ